MKKEKVGIKFCGGCNEQYNRRKALDRYLAAHPEWEQEYVKEGESYDRILLIQGCGRECLRNYSAAKAERYITFASAADYEKA